MIPSAVIETLKADLARMQEALARNAGQLRASEERFKSLVAIIPDIVYRIDPDGVFLYLNTAVQRLGYRPEELVGRHFSDIIAPGDCERISRKIVLGHPSAPDGVTGEVSALFDERRTDHRRTTGLEVRLVPKNAGGQCCGFVAPLSEKTISMEISCSGMYEVSPDTRERVFLGTVGIIRDISARKKAQIELITVEKMGAMGTLIAGIAHELNNPMMGMLNFIEYCIRHTDPDDRRFPVLADAERETRRCIDIVRSLLTFSSVRPEVNHTRRACVLGELIQRTLSLLNYRIEKSDVTVRMGGERTLRALVTASAIQQVFLNLLGNALDALEDRDDKTIAIDIHRSDEQAVVTITDNGTGISEQHMPKIFDPFYTTKPPGRGSGMGLSVSRAIVNDHGGRLTCRSQPGTGTTVELQLPMAAATKDDPI